MKIKLKTCPVCGRTFEAKNSRAIYCSGKCKSRAFRRHGRSEPIRDPEESEIQKEEQRKRDLEIRSKHHRQEVEAAAAAGDPFCRMQVARRFSPEYFSALADYETQFAQQSGKASTCKVNGFSVYDDHFAEDAAASVAEDGICITTRS